MYKTQNWNNVRSLRIEYLPCRAFIGDAWPWPFKSRDTTVETSPRRQLSTCPANLWNRQILIRSHLKRRAKKNPKTHGYFTDIHGYFTDIHGCFMDISWILDDLRSVSMRVVVVSCDESLAASPQGDVASPTAARLSAAVRGFAPKESKHFCKDLIETFERILWTHI